MNNYRPRKIEFRSIARVNDWQVKIYTITFKTEFDSNSVLHYAISNLPKWLEKAKHPEFETHQNAFLIVHEGRDGVWTLLNWWIGENMLQTLTFRTGFDDLESFEETPETGGMACVWELEIINFERKMWIEYVLKKVENPDFTGYLNQKLNGEF